MAEGESLSQHAAAASQRALEMAGVAAEEVDLIILATSSPDDLFGSACQVGACNLSRMHQPGSSLVWTGCNPYPEALMFHNGSAKEALGSASLLQMLAGGLAYWKSPIAASRMLPF